MHLGKEETTRQKAEALYESLMKAKFEVLWDDREAGAGEKLNDADLIGISVRLLVSAKSLEKGGVEWKERAEAESRIVEEEDVVASLQKYYE